MHGKILKNSSANLINRFWTIFVNIVFVPIYLNFLGLDAYGLVTFFVTLQIILDLLGVGLSKTLRREFSYDNHSHKNITYKYKVLRSIENIYFFIGLIIIAVCFLGSQFIANKWLSSYTIDSNTIQNCISLMGLSIAFQLIANLYLGCLFGLERQVIANTHQVIWSMFKNVGIVTLFLLAKPSILLFFVWYTICDAIYMLINRFRLIWIMKKNGNIEKWKISDFNILKNVYKYAFGVMLISIGYCINTQVDKVIISKQFDLAVVGAYNTTFTLSVFSTIFCTAVGIALFPRFTKLCSTDKNQAFDLFKLYNTIVCIFTITLGSFLSFYSTEILNVWTQGNEISTIIGTGAIFIILGTCLVALQEIPYNFLLAQGITKLNNIQTFFCLLFVIILTPVFITKWGVFGASLAWLINMGLSTLLYLSYFYYKYFRLNGLIYMTKYTILPFIIILLFAYLSHKLTVAYFKSEIIIIGIGVCGGLFVLGIFSIILYKKYRYVLK